MWCCNAGSVVCCVLCRVLVPGADDDGGAGEGKNDEAEGADVRLMGGRCRSQATPQQSSLAHTQACDHSSPGSMP